MLAVAGRRRRRMGVTMSPRRLFAAAVLLALGAGGLTLFWQWPAEPTAAVAVPAALPATSTPLVLVPSAKTDSSGARRKLSQPLVPAMADTEIDGDLRTDAAGNLVLDLAVRDYFDYFLSAVDQVGLEAALGAMIEDARGRLQEPALGQFSRLLADYLDYKRASLALLQQPLSAAQQSRPQEQLGALQQAFERLAQLRRAHLDAAAVEAFFGAEEAYAHFTLDSLAVQSREDLSAEAKAAAIEALRERLPEAMRASETRQAEIAAQQAESERLLREGADEEQIRSFLSMTYDPPTVERLLTEQRAERDWQRRYSQYRDELAALQSNGLSEADRAREGQRLRQRLFDAQDLHRVETYDAIAAKQTSTAIPSQ
jgi:lipase chaperone LimK